MKTKILIFRTEEVDGKKLQQTLRTVDLHPSFCGFAKNGMINKSEFDNLAKDLEPSNTGWKFLN